MVKHGKRTLVGLLMLLLTAVGAVLVTSQPANAETGGYPYASYNGPGSNPSMYVWTDDGGNAISTYHYYYRNCTDFVAWKLATVNAWNPNLSMGNGMSWGSWATNRGYTVDMNPAVGAVAWWNANAFGMSAYGHVAYVTGISGDQVTIQEYNNPGGGNWGTRTFAKSQVSGYIHFKDVQTPGTGTRLLGDVNGDGKQDAVVMFRDSGTAMVALSTGSSFASPTSWSYLHTVEATKYFLGDVNGDNKADLVAFWVSNGRWRVSLSSGTGFWPETEWAMGQGTGTSKQWVVDVDGDPQHKADMITFDSATGDWWVSTSTGTGFGPTQYRYVSGHGVGSSDQFVADFDGNGMGDAAVYFASSGNWYVGKSPGYNFGIPYQWSAGHGVGSTKRFAGDVTGGGKADAVYFWSDNGLWRTGVSDGNGFYTPTDWAFGHGVGTSEQFLSDVSGDGKSDMVTFDQVTGDWWVSTSSGSGFWPPVRWISGHGAGS